MRRIAIANSDSFEANSSAEKTVALAVALHKRVSGRKVEMCNFVELRAGEMGVEEDCVLAYKVFATLTFMVLFVDESLLDMLDFINKVRAFLVCARFTRAVRELFEQVVAGRVR